MTSQLSDADVAGIRAVMVEIIRTFLAGDFAGYSEVFTVDGVLMPPNSPSVEGRSAIQRFGESFPKVTAMDFTDVQIEGVDGLAVGRTAYSLTMTPEGAGAVQDKGKQMGLFRRQPDGSWLATAAIFNSDLPAGG